jgi:hypothetical protein
MTDESCESQGHQIPIIGRKAYLKNKRTTGRTQDLANVEALENGGVD